MDRTDATSAHHTETSGSGLPFLSPIPRDRSPPHRIAAAALPEGARPTADLVVIGIRFAAQASVEPNIEGTRVAASVEGMERDDLRVLAVTTTWLGVHGARVNADRLHRALAGKPSLGACAYRAAVRV